MFKADIKIDEKEYFRCSMFYLRKYFYIRELILLAVLTACAVSFYVLMDNALILILLAVTVCLIAFALILFVVTAKATYKHEYVKLDIAHVRLVFHDDGFDVETFDAVNEPKYAEEFLFKNIDKIALRPNRIYIYATGATIYYITPEQLTEGSYEDLRVFLIDHVPPEKFKMKTRIKQFPGYSKSRQIKDNDEGKNG